MIKLWFDGACFPVNPGGTASYGWIARKETSFLHENWGVIGKGEFMSNNVAEYMGLYNGLKWLKEQNLHTDEILCLGDSNLVIKQMNGEWRVNSGLYVDAFKKTFLLARHFKNISYRWIPREQNGHADYLSKHPFRVKRSAASPLRDQTECSSPPTTDKEGDLYTQDPAEVVK